MITLVHSMQQELKTALRDVMERRQITNVELGLRMHTTANNIANWRSPLTGKKTDRLIPDHVINELPGAINDFNFRVQWASITAHLNLVGTNQFKLDSQSQQIHMNCEESDRTQKEPRANILRSLPESKWTDDDREFWRSYCKEKFEEIQAEIWSYTTDIELAR